jgi:hypothetical protein
LQRRQARTRSSFSHFRLDRFETALHWLNSEGHVDNNRGKDQPLKAEHEGVAPHGLPSLAKRRIPAKGDKQVVAENGWRQNQWQGKECFDEAFAAKFAKRQQPAGEYSERQQDQYCRYP